MKRLLVRILAATVLTCVGVAVVPASSAMALGNNRTVSRSCGTNYVSSGWTGSYSWAQTKKVSGDCAGRLSAGLEFYNGYRTRVPGSNTSAYTSNPAYARYGLHWGCDNCNVTFS